VRIFSSPFNFPFAVLSQVKNCRHSAAAEKKLTKTIKNRTTNSKKKTKSGRKLQTDKAESSGKNVCIT